MPKNAGKAAKARKSSHKKSRVAKAVREAVIESKESSKKTKKLPRRVSSVNDENKENDEVFERAPADFNEETEWDIEVRIAVNLMLYQRDFDIIGLYRDSVEST